MNKLEYGDFLQVTAEFLEYLKENSPSDCETISIGDKAQVVFDPGDYETVVVRMTRGGKQFVTPYFIAMRAYARVKSYEQT